LAILSVEAPVWQGTKTQEYQDILSFRNAVRRDASALKMLSYFCASPNYKSCRNSELFQDFCTWFYIGYIRQGWPEAV